MKPPLISIAMPVWNCEKTVAVAVRSILNQTFQDWELLVFDDGSTDGTLAELNQFQDNRIKVLADTHNKGLASRLNEAIKMTKGEFFGRMDGDDVSYPKRLELQLDYLRSHPGVDLIGGGVLVFDGDGRFLGKRIPPESHAAICRRPSSGFPMAHPTFCGKTAWFRLHKYSASFPLAQDQDLLLRSYRSSRFANLPEIVMGYRENRLSWMKLAKGRNCLTRAVCRQLKVEGRGRLIPAAILQQALKSAADWISIVTGLKYKLLRHRATSITGEERQEWRQVYQSVTP